MAVIISEVLSLSELDASSLSYFFQVSVSVRFLCRIVAIGINVTNAVSNLRL
jgi:hypothetical protein